MTYGTFSFPYNSCNAKELNLINSSDNLCHEEPIVKQQHNNEIKALNLCDDDLDHGLLNTHGRPTPKPRENNVEAEIHFNITEERKTVFTSGFLYLKA